MIHEEHHKTHRVGWFRASVLGANDGIVSTSSLIIGISAANAPAEQILLAGVAGLVAGAMSMAAGEYVSVCSQADTERADMELEKKSLIENREAETHELAHIYVDRGLDPDLAMTVARQLMKNDALEAHARDEIGISDAMSAKPVQAALFSAIMFSIGAALPLLVTWLAPLQFLIPGVALCSLLFLSILGAIAAMAGGASMLRGALRVSFWGALAMALTAGVGKLFDVIV